eukprot:scaffold243475_cov38-Prasinocladus_malaysianus.AAC.1
MDDAFGLGDLGLGGSTAPAAAPPPPDLPEILDVNRGKGLRICGRVERVGGAPVYRMALSNTTGGQVSGFMIQFNKNSFGLVPGAQEISV